MLAPQVSTGLVHYGLVFAWCKNGSLPRSRRILKDRAEEIRRPVSILFQKPYPRLELPALPITPCEALRSSSPMLVVFD